MFEDQACVSLYPTHIQTLHFLRSCEYRLALIPASAPGLVFWFADADASSATAYPPTTFRWIDNQKEAEEAVDAAKKKAAKRAAGEE